MRVHFNRDDPLIANLTPDVKICIEMMVFDPNFRPIRGLKILNQFSLIGSKESCDARRANGRAHPLLKSEFVFKSDWP